MKAPGAGLYAGIDLKVMRVRQCVRLRDVAAGMGVSHQRVAQIESYARPSSAAVGRYIEALGQATESRG
jgi:hypothetical protein